MTISVDDARFYIASVRTFLIWNTSGQAHLSSLEAIIEKSRTGLERPFGPPTTYDMWQDLIDSSVKSPAVRQVFAQSGMFEFILKFERAGALDRFWGTPALVGRAMRLIMLKGIYDARESSLLTGDDSTGVVTWIQSSAAGLAAVVDTLLNDHTALLTRGVICQIIADLTIPESWAKGIPSSVPMASPTPSPLLSAVESFRTEITTIDTTVTVRADLARSADRAHARLIAVAGGAQGARQGSGTSVFDMKLPDGSTIKVAGGKPVPWYERPRYWVLGALGALTGMALANRARKA